MKNTLTFAFILLCASLVHGQSPCLVVNQHKNTRIDSIGDVGKLHTHYSERQLRKLSDRGVHVISIPNSREFVSAREACGESESASVMIERMEQHEAHLDRPEEKRCIEFHTSSHGEECVLWVTLPSEQVQH